MTDSAGINHSPVWSPDGRFVYFVSDREGPTDIYRIRADGGAHGTRAPHGRPRRPEPLALRRWPAPGVQRLPHRGERLVRAVRTSADESPRRDPGDARQPERGEPERVAGREAGVLRQRPERHVAALSGAGRRRRAGAAHDRQPSGLLAGALARRAHAGLPFHPHRLARGLAAVARRRHPDAAHQHAGPGGPPALVAGRTDARLGPHRRHRRYPAGATGAGRRVRHAGRAARVGHLPQLLAGRALARLRQCPGRDPAPVRHAGGLGRAAIAGRLRRRAAARRELPQVLQRRAGDSLHGLGRREGCPGSGPYPGRAAASPSWSCEFDDPVRQPYRPYWTLSRDRLFVLLQESESDVWVVETTGM